MSEKPEALLIYPAIYDFALYDLFLKPYGLLSMGRLLETAGWKTRFVNVLDYNDVDTVNTAGQVKRKCNGTGKFHRRQVRLPDQLRGIKRYFARYGILPEVFRAKAAVSRPDAVFIATGMTYWYKGVAEAVELCRGLWPDVPIITGGVYATLMPEHCMRECGPDRVFAGSMIKLYGDSYELSDSGIGLDSFLRNRGLPGIVTDGTAPKPLDAPCWNDAAVLKLNDGCPMNCDYCASHRLCRGFTNGNHEAVFGRLKFLAETRGTRNFAFYDDALLFASEDAFIPLLHEVIEYSRSTGTKFNFYTPNAIHIRYMTAEIAKLMKQAGFMEVRLGFESSSDEFHLEHDNKYSERGFHNTVRILTEAGFDHEEIIVYILAGLPGQLAAEVEDTIMFAGREGLNLSISEFSPVPGSPLWPECVKRCNLPLAEEPLFHNNSFFPMEWEGFTRDDMQRLKVLSKKK